MTEPTPERESDTQRIVSQLQYTYKAHKNLPPDERLRNDLGNNLTPITGNATLWEARHKKTPEEINEFMAAGFRKLKSLYNDTELVVADEILDKVVQKEKDRQQETGERLMVTPYIEANRHLLHEKPETK